VKWKSQEFSELIFTELLGDTARILTDKKPVVHSRNMQLSPESRD
jgi:hypothetical protein